LFINALRSLWRCVAHFSEAHEYYAKEYDSMAAKGCGNEAIVGYPNWTLL